MGRIIGSWDLFDEIDQPEPTPGCPEVVVIAGFLGLHLARPDGFRIWLTPPAFALCDVATELSIDPAQPDLAPDGLNEIVYSDLVHDLRRAGIVTHAFAFDFRRPVRDVARDLAQALIAKGEGKRFVLVAHSMGALVAALYPDFDVDWQSRIERAIFLGGTVSGTFEVVDAARGAHPIIGRLSKLSAWNTPEGYAACMRTWPGLYDMLPDPAHFQGAARAFDASAWPDDERPHPDLLANAQKTRQDLSLGKLGAIPIAHLLSVRFSTADEYAEGEIGVGSRSAAGDGTVVARTLLGLGQDVYRVDLPHTLIPLDPAAIRAVIELVLGGTTSLPRVTEAEASARIHGAEPTLDEIVFEYVKTTLAHPDRIARLIWMALLLGPRSW